MTHSGNMLRTGEVEGVMTIRLGLMILFSLLLCSFEISHVFQFEKISK